MREEDQIGQIEYKEKASSKRKKFLIAAGGIVIALAVLGMTLWGFGNTYRKPVAVVEKYENAEEYRLIDRVVDAGGGLARRELKAVYKTLICSDAYLDAEEEFLDYTIYRYEDRLDKYGDDFKIDYKIMGRSELSKADLREYRAEIQDYVYELESIVDETEEFNSSDWGALAQELELMKSETKTLIENFQRLVEAYGRIEVSKGYELDVTRTVTGSALDEPEEDELSMIVVKVNGRWLLASDFADYTIEQLF